MPVEKLNTGPGRIVWGHPCNATIKKDQNSGQPVLRDGKQIEQWVFGVAFPKAEFMQRVWPYMQQEAATGYPNGVPANFSWKIKDGDGIDPDGKKYSDREGYAGCYVLTVSTEAFCPTVHKWENNGWRQLEAKEIKCGDYVALSLNIKLNIPQNKTHTPGLYINPNGIEFVGYGSEIRNTANPAELFGAQRHQLPPGASATPVGGTAQPPGFGGAPAGGFAAPVPHAAPATGYPPQTPGYAPAAAPQGGGYPQGGFAPAPQPAAHMPPPAHDFVHNAGAPAGGFAPTGAPPMGAAPHGGFAPPAGGGFPAAGPHGAPPMGAPAGGFAPTGAPGAPGQGQWPQGMPGVPQGR